MRLPLTAALVFLASFALAAISPRQDYTSDCSTAPVKRYLVFSQASSQLLGWTFTQGTTAKDLTGATLVTFTYVPASRAWSQVITGAVDVATNGSVLITCTPAQLNTNTSASGVLDWILQVEDADEVLAFAYGKLTLLADFTAGITNTFPTTTATVDWSTVAAYTHTADYGPVRPGSGIGHTTNADGSVTFTAAAASGSVTGVVGDTEFVVTGSGGHVVTGAIGNAIARDTEVTAATQSVYTAAVAASAAAGDLAYLRLNGSSPMAGMLNMANNSMTNLGVLHWDNGVAGLTLALVPAAGPLPDSLVLNGYGLVNAEIWNSSHDGTGSGLDADLLDGLHRTSFWAVTGATASAGAVFELQGSVITNAGTVQGTNGIFASLQLGGGAAITNIDTSSFSDLQAYALAISNRATTLEGQTNSYWWDSDQTTFSNWVGSTFFTVANQTTFSNYIGSTYWTSASQTTFSNYVAGAYASKTATHSQDFSFYVTNMAPWTRSSVYVPVARTITAVYCRAGTSTGTVYVGTHTNGESWSAGGTSSASTTNATAAGFGITNTAATINSAALAAGVRMALWLDNAASSFANGTNDIDVTVVWTESQ